MKDAHNKAAEHHESEAKSHRAAADSHGKNDHAKRKDHAAQAQQHAQNAQEHSKTANAKSAQKLQASGGSRHNRQLSQAIVPPQYSFVKVIMGKPTSRNRSLNPSASLRLVRTHLDG
jgi:hypothetical protein